MGQKDKKSRAVQGVCKLTGEYGYFAHSHILPKSLTRLGNKGEKRWETKNGRGMGKRYDSWFDDELVIYEGERILEAIDTPAIVMLRKHKLVWSSWGNALKIPIPDFPGDPEDVNIRTVFFEKPNLIKLFFLSLVWRAAASERREMDDVIIPSDILEDIRLRVFNKEIGDIRDYPVHLHQITTLGDKHNRTPLLEAAYAIDEGGNQTDVVLNRVRIYIDGLVAQVYLYKSDQILDHYSNISVGCLQDGGTFVFGMPFSESRSLTDFQEVLGELAANSNSDGYPERKNAASSE